MNKEIKRIEQYEKMLEKHNNKEIDKLINELKNAIRELHYIKVENVNGYNHSFDIKNRLDTAFYKVDFRSIEEEE